MLIVADVKKERQIEMNNNEKQLFGIDKLNVSRSDIPAITHIDYSARIQTVNKSTNPDYYNIIAEFEKHYGSAVIVNTSFNVRGEPIVCTPSEAYTCFMRTKMDYLVLGNYLLRKEDQEELKDDIDWKKEFELD
jgi:carbamoyltransferase